MSDITVTYKNAPILKSSIGGNFTLNTKGKACEDDITVSYQVPSSLPPDCSKICYNSYKEIPTYRTIIENGFLLTGRPQFYPIKQNATGIHYISFTSPFEIGICFKIKEMNNSHQALFGSTGTSYFIFPSAEFNENGNGNIWAGFSTDGSSWTNNLSLPNGTVQTGVWYHFRYIWDGSVFKIGISTDFINYTEASSPQTSPHYDPTGKSRDKMFCFGMVNSRNVPEYISVNLLGAYIKVNGNIVWGCDYCEQNRTFDIP